MLQYCVFTLVQNRALVPVANRLLSRFFNRDWAFGTNELCPFVPAPPDPGQKIFFQNKKNLPALTSPAARSRLLTCQLPLFQTFILSDKIIHETNHNRNPQTNHAHNLSQIIHIISFPNHWRRKKNKKEITYSVVN